MLAIDISLNIFLISRIKPGIVWEKEAGNAIFNP
jgi:hypothetical protein